MDAAAYNPKTLDTPIALAVRELGGVPCSAGFSLRPYYSDASVIIYHGDMRELAPRMPTVDATITDPPYGETNLEWDTWPQGWPDRLVNLTPQIWCFGSLRMFWEKRDDFAAWRLAQDIVWEKHNGSGLHNDRFRRVHELAVHVYRGRWKNVYHAPVFTYDATRRNVKRGGKPAHWGGISRGAYSTAENGPRLMRSVIYSNSTHQVAEHPTQKPESIISPLIEYSVPVGGLVLDPFMGSGTTLRVAKNLGRRAIGIEVNEKYCEVAAKRCAQDALALGG